MSHNNEKTSINLEIIFKSLGFFEKALKAFKKSLNSIENVFKKPRNFYESLKLIIKSHNSLKMSLKSLKIFQIASHYWKKPQFFFECFKKASHHFNFTKQVSRKPRNL
jgi:tetratricopeptide (TPR) repeat protein